MRGQFADEGSILCVIIELTDVVIGFCRSSEQVILVKYKSSA
jgi:hypothetical protein